MRFLLPPSVALLLAGMPLLTSPARAQTAATEIVYEGHLIAEGHFARPGDTRRFGALQRFSRAPSGAVRLESTRWSQGDSSRVPEVFLVVKDRVFRRGAPGRPWEELAGMAARIARFHSSAAFPKSRGTSVRSAQAHPRLGDVVDSVHYAYEGKDPVPVSLRIRVHELHHQWTLDVERVSLRRADLPDSLFEAPTVFDPAPEHPDTLVEAATLNPVGEGVWSVDMEDIDSRSLVVEFADHLAVIEVALSSANGERLVDVVKRQFPSKPIRYALFSHHHPHYLGGLRALIAEGATVVTTPGNDSLVHAIAEYPFRLRPDRLARTPHPVRVLPFPGRVELADSTNRLVALNIGERSQHTAEFVLFWLPRQRLLFEAEQGWVTVDGTLRASRRASALLEIVAEEKLDVERFVQAWPMRGNRAEVTRSELEELLARRR